MLEQRARAARVSWGRDDRASPSGSGRRAHPASEGSLVPFRVIPTSTTRRSRRPRTRVTSPRRLRRSTRRVTSGSRAIIRSAMSPHANRVGWLPRRMRSTLYWLGVRLAVALRNFSHGSDDARRRDADAEQDLLLARGERALSASVHGQRRQPWLRTIVVQTTIVKRDIPGRPRSQRGCRSVSVPARSAPRLGT